MYGLVMVVVRTSVIQVVVVLTVVTGSESVSILVVRIGLQVLELFQLQVLLVLVLVILLLLLVLVLVVEPYPAGALARRWTAAATRPCETTKARNVKEICMLCAELGRMLENQGCEHTRQMYKASVPRPFLWCSFAEGKDKGFMVITLWLCSRCDDRSVKTKEYLEGRRASKQRAKELCMDRKVLRSYRTPHLSPCL